MDITELEAMRDALEAALLAGAGKASVTIGDVSVTYKSESEARAALARVNRSITRYNQKAAGQAPGMRTASFS